MSIYTENTRRAVVRWQFGDCNTLRAAMGGQEPLLVLACPGPLDAPESIPAGAHESSNHGPMAQRVGR